MKDTGTKSVDDPADEEIVDDALVLRRTLERRLPSSRELSLALTKLDECLLWALKANAEQLAKIRDA